MVHPLLVSLARRTPFLSRAIHQIETLKVENAALRQGLADVTAKAADLEAWHSIVTTQWYKRDKASFDADGLIVTDRPIAFLSDPEFQNAYKYGVDSGHHFLGANADPKELHVEWRVAICCWAAWHAKHFDGDFVECGVNTGIFSRAICRYIDFNKTAKHFYLFDTFEGVPLEQAEGPRKDELSQFNKLHYPDVWELAVNNFAEFPLATPIRGRVPEILPSVDIGRVAYLSIDMNIPLPEIAALKYFWPKMVTGGVVVFDDYGFSEDQRDALDQLTASWGLKIWALPTGQGILFKT